MIGVGVMVVRKIRKKLPWVVYKELVLVLITFLRVRNSPFVTKDISPVWVNPKLSPYKLSHYAKHFSNTSLEDVW